MFGLDCVSVLVAQVFVLSRKDHRSPQGWPYNLSFVLIGVICVLFVGVRDHQQHSDCDGVLYLGMYVCVSALFSVDRFFSALGLCIVGPKTSQNVVSLFNKRFATTATPG